MEVFFNELSVRPASSNAEARYWIETLADVARVLRDVIESLGDNGFKIRISENFNSLPFVGTQPMIAFLQEQFGYSDPVFVFLLGVLDAPYIGPDDPKRIDYEFTSLTFAGQDHPITGLAAAYLKNTVAVSFDSGADWDTCYLDVVINHLDTNARETSTPANIAHSSRKQHILDCHLSRLADLFDWTTYRPRFDCDAKTQTLLSLIDLYSLHVESWKSFYHDLSQLNERDRITSINRMAGQIAVIQRWQPATGSLKAQNADRTIYMIPDSNLIVSVDTQHGEFEIHAKQKGNNHLGAVSFDGQRFKSAKKDRSLTL